MTISTFMTVSLLRPFSALKKNGVDAARLTAIAVAVRSRPKS